MGDYKKIADDIEKAEAIYGEYCPTDDYCDNTVRLPGTLYQNFVAPPVKYIYDTAYGILCPPLEDVKPSTPADIFKKFVFSMVKLAQVYMVYQIMQGVSVPDETPTTGAFTYYIPYTIAGSFLLQFLDFALSMFPKTGFHQIVCTFQTMLTTFILNLLTTPNWGAKGEYVTLLQDVVKNQALINTLDFGLINALFPLPNCFEIALKALDDLFQMIYDYCIKPVVDFVVFCFQFIIDWIIMPPINFIVLVVSTLYGWIAFLVSTVFGWIVSGIVAITGWIAWCCGATADDIVCCCGWVGDTCNSMGVCFGDICNSMGGCLYNFITCGWCTCCVRKVRKVTNDVEELQVALDASGQYVEMVKFKYTDDSPESESVYGSSNQKKTSFKLKEGSRIQTLAIFETKDKGLVGMNVVTSDGRSKMFGTKGMDNVIYDYNCKRGEDGIFDVVFERGSSNCVGFLKNIKIIKTGAGGKAIVIKPLEPKETQIEKVNCLASCGLQI